MRDANRLPIYDFKNRYAFLALIRETTKKCLHYKTGVL